MYERPTLPDLVFTDADGEPIPYGSRWGVDGAPERTYSRTRHPERFAPLTQVADALVAYLEETYDVDVRRTEGMPADAPDTVRRHEHGQVAIVRTTTLLPRHDACAPLVIAETDFPGIVVAMGAAGDERVPACGCDACDESLEDSAALLEDLVLSVAQGRFQERYTWTDGIEITISGGEDGASYSREPRHAADKKRIEALKQSQRERHGERWMPWPPRRDDADGAWEREPEPMRLWTREEREAVLDAALERVKKLLRSA
ncbi:DUF6226 family protein [Demequina mangrovi]|uniref:Uncharacterized protein n=1 Tax=Demequina mangrovi TaxID=1043493 RepID=A0A1H6ZPT4_9MICO|nr:DUF6226 family protein [Demequina mangrovi]SEJ50815.1 hypothetical protein SAMN05421637_2067 [Demequina mangrovi]